LGMMRSLARQYIGIVSLRDVIIAMRTDGVYSILIVVIIT